MSSITTTSCFSRSLVASAVVASLLLPLAATAETKTLSTVKVQAKATETSGADSYQAEKVSSPKRPQKLLDTPKSIQVVTEKAMKEQGVTSLRDALKNISGISMAAGEGGVPTGDNLTIRGFSARTDLFVDGLRDIAGYNRDSFNMEQVEVAKGPDSAVSGRGSTGGSVNMASKSAKLDAATSLELGLGTDGYKRAVLDVNQPIADSAAFRVAVLSHDADHPGRSEATSQRWGVAPTLAFGIDSDTRFSASHLHQTENNLPDYGIPYGFVPGESFLGSDGKTYRLAVPTFRPAEVERDNFYGLTTRDYEDINADITTLKLEHDINDSASLRSVVRAGRVERESVVTAPRHDAPAIKIGVDAGGKNITLPAYTGLVNSTGKGRDTRDSLLANQTDLTLKFATGDIKHTVVTGLELSKERSEANSMSVPNGPKHDLFRPNPAQPFTGVITQTGHVETESTSQALYALDTAEFAKDWFATVGLRYDNFETDYVNDVFATNSAARTLTTLNSHDETLNWNAGLSFKPSDNDALYLSYATSVNPSAEGLSLSTANANLDPEESRSLELGAKSQLLNDSLLLAGAIFRTDKSNARTPSIDGSKTVLEGEQRVQGFELSATGFVNDWMQVIASYTKLDAEIIDSNTPAEIGKKLAHVPPQSFSLWTTLQATDALSFGIGAQYKDTVSNNVSNTANNIPDYTLYDAMAAYQISANVGLRLNAYNLTDERYFGTVGGGHTIPGAGRSAVLTGTVTF